MKYRHTEILSLSALAAAGTKIIPINLQDPISRIEIAYKMTLASNAMAAQLGANLPKIELVDGSDVLHSLSGLANQALCIYDRRIPTMNEANLTNGGSAWARFGIDFGRYLFDPELAFDPTKFRNPQLKITHQVNICDTSAADDWLEINAWCFDEKVISPVGFLMAKEHNAWTPSGSGVYEYIDLPTDHPIRQLLIRGFLTQVHPDGVVIGARLSEDHDKRVPFDFNLSDYLRHMRGSWLPVEDGCIEYVGASSEYDKYLTPTTYETAWYGATFGNDTVGIDTYLPGGWLRLVTDAPVMVNGIMRGYCPNHTFQIPLGNQQDLDDWYETSLLGSLVLRLLSGGSAGATSVVTTILQQLRKY